MVRTRKIAAQEAAASESSAGSIEAQDLSAIAEAFKAALNDTAADLSGTRKADRKKKKAVHGSILKDIRSDIQVAVENAQSSSKAEVSGIEDAAATVKAQERGRKKKSTAGRAWHHMPEGQLTPDVEQHFKLLKSRAALDAKRHYRASEINPKNKFFQVGTVIEGPTEYYSSRMAKKQRGSTFAKELLADEGVQNWTTKKFREVQKRGIKKRIVKSKKKSRR